MSALDLATNSVRNVIASFHPKALPPMLRANYGREMLAWWFLPLMLGAVEGGVMSVIVKKSFSGVESISDTSLNFAVAAVAASPALANILSFFWAWVAHGRSKVKFITGLQIATAVLVALMALAPRSLVGLVLICVGVYGARICWSGVILIRTAVWRNNYPRADRARVAGKLASIQGIMLAIVAYVLSLSMDCNEESFRLLFPLAAIGGLVGTSIYGKVRLRGQRRLARAEQLGAKKDRLSLNPLSVWRVLANDAHYRRFMRNMFVFGLGNLMLLAPLAIILQEHFAFNYQSSILITSAIPTLMMPLTIPMWARLLDRTHVIGFRAIHCWVFVAATSSFLIAAATHQGWMMFLAAMMLGVAYGGGVLAWNLGHHDFAGEHNSSQYMGVHVTLTGLRGLIAPFLGVGIYQSLEMLQAGAGAWVFLPCVVLNLIGAFGFSQMRKELPERQAVPPDPCEDWGRPAGQTAGLCPRQAK